MAEARKVLGQLSPSATALTALYTVPGATEAVCSTLVVCNRGATNSTFRVSVAVAGAADDNKQYLYYDVAIQATDTFMATLGLTLAATDVVRVYSSSTNLSFALYGVEIT